jgi:hypothetical protein
MLTLTFEFLIFIIVVVMVQQMDLTLYDAKGSHTSEIISCDQEFCSSTYDGPIPGCKAETPCPYSITYGDGSATTGYYVRDYLNFDFVNGNLHTAPQNSSIIFGSEFLFIYTAQFTLYCIRKKQTDIVLLYVVEFSGNHVCCIRVP